MKFDVRSGKHFKTVDASGFNQAANVFLTDLLSSGNSKVGDVIHVSCTSTEVYLNTTDVLRRLNKSKLKIHREDETSTSP